MTLEREEKTRVFVGKQFEPRNSLFTDFFEISHFQTIYRLFVILLIFLFIRSNLCELLDGKTPTLGTINIVRGFSGFHIVLIVWLIICCIALATYPAFCYWASKRSYRTGLLSNDTVLKIWDATWLLGVVMYCILIIYIPLRVRGIPAAIGSNMALAMEELRFIMKIHAFLRTAVPEVLAYKTKKNKTLILPTFSQYLYYLFAPTFIYRDNYPRTNKIRWGFVRSNLLDVIGVIFICSLLAEIAQDKYADFGLQPETWKSLIMYVFWCMLGSPLIMVLGFYMLLHSWMNACAEMLTFADRSFYGDWWTSTTFRSYYRKWNLVVYEYLHEFVYKDVLVYISPGNRTFATCLIFLISGVFHEYVLFSTFDFLMPILFIEFSILSLPVTLLRNMSKPDRMNLFLLAGIAVGTSIEINCYYMEHYARMNCPKIHESVWDYINLRIMSCNGLHLK